MFHPIHFTALITTLIVSGALWLAHQLNNPMVFIAGCLVVPLVSSIGRFEREDREDEPPPDHDYGDEPRAGFHARLPADK